MKILIAAFALFPVLVFAQPGTVSEVIESASPSDWRTLEPENTLYMELPSGRVIIELALEFAPHTVANVKTLAKEKYWDGLAVVRVQDGYVVQWADPNAEKPEAKKAMSIPAKLKAEFEIPYDRKMPFQKLKDKDVYAAETGFSKGFAIARDPKGKKAWLTHCYGSVGVGRDNDPDSGNGAELYAVIGHAPRHLDRNVTVIGRVIQGIEFLSSLPRGKGKMGFYEDTKLNIPIKSIRLASEVPEKDRVALEVLRTDTPVFARLIEARRSRQEDWFRFKAGRIDVCNVPVPVRPKSQPSKP